MTLVNQTLENRGDTTLVQQRGRKEERATNPDVGELVQAGGQLRHQIAPPMDVQGEQKQCSTNAHLTPFTIMIAAKKLAGGKGSSVKSTALKTGSSQPGIT